MPINKKKNDDLTRSKLKFFSQFFFGKAPKAEKIIKFLRLVYSTEKLP